MSFRLLFGVIRWLEGLAAAINLERAVGFTLVAILSANRGQK
jgi:hypothetical protein